MEVTSMRRVLLTLGALLLVMTTGCARKQTSMDATSADSDSLLASNPMEQPSGNITPQTDYNNTTEPPAQEAPPASTTKPASKPVSKPHTTTHTSHTPSTTPVETGVRVEAGTPLNISIATQVSSETANVGDTWSGELKDNVIVGDRVVFPAGSQVSGVITEANPAKKGERARLGLAVTSITVNGTRHDVDAGTEAIEAGSTRARNLGAVAGGTAAGALIGKAVGGGKGALVGALIGAGATGAGVAASKGYQVVLTECTNVTFNVKQSVTVRS
jgi:hypothetical protein